MDCYLSCLQLGRSRLDGSGTAVALRFGIGDGDGQFTSSQSRLGGQQVRLPLGPAGGPAQLLGLARTESVLRLVGRNAGLETCQFGTRGGDLSLSGPDGQMDRALQPGPFSRELLRARTVSEGSE